MKNWNKVEGGMLGLLLGDAVGVPYEFHAPENLPPLEQLLPIPPKGFRRAHSGVPTGTWSDDGAQALALLDSLLTQNRLDVADFSERLVSWYAHNHYAVDGVFDIGNQTSVALRRLESGCLPSAAGPCDEQSNGNGSLMRVLPLALWHRGGDVELVDLAHRQSEVTHGHERSLVCCALYCLWARGLLQEREQPLQWAVSVLSSLYRNTRFEAELQVVLAPFEPKGTGYVVDSVHTTMAVLDKHNSFQAVVQNAIAYGFDTDTSAAIAGGLAGIRAGTEGLPPQWVKGLRGAHILRPLLGRLRKHLGGFSGVRARVRVIVADITTLPVDAIVNAANSSLLGGGGVDGAIHRSAGPELVQECRLLHGCKTGEAKVTKGYRLPAKQVIHTVGPVYQDGERGEAERLASCYLKSLEVAHRSAIATIAFPCISTGVYGYPKKEAAKVAVEAVVAFLANDTQLQEVVFCCYDAENAELYEELVKEL